MRKIRTRGKIFPQIGTPRGEKKKTQENLGNLLKKN